jgi:hypothetical protein
LIIAFRKLQPRYKKVESTYLSAYKISGADKNIGTVLAIADYLLGISCARDNVKTVADKEVRFYGETLFGGLKDARKGLRMIRAFYYRDYQLLHDIYEEGQNPSDMKKIKSALNTHEDKGSFPTGYLLTCVYTSSFYLIGSLRCVTCVSFPLSSSRPLIPRTFICKWDVGVAYSHFGSRRLSQFGPQ